MSNSVGRRTGISTINLIAGGVLWACVLIAASLAMLNSQPAQELEGGQKAEESAAPVVLQPQESSVKIGFPARELPEFEFPECMGGTVSRDGLKGHPWVASFVFTRCTTTCPMITKEVMELHRRVAATNPDVKFVSFSVDSSFDSAEVLRKYAEIYSADHDRWKFVTGDELAIHTLIGQGFALYVKPNLGEQRKPGFEVAHSNRVVLVNSDSIPVATFLATRAEDMVKLRRILEGKDPFPEPGPALSFTISSGATDGAQPDINLELRKVEEQPPLAPETNATPDADIPDTEEPEASEPETAVPGTALQNSDPSAMSNQNDGVLPELSAGSVVHNQRIDQLLPAWAKPLPTLNAVLNGCSTILLLAGYLAIRVKRKTAHRNLMVTAFGVSVVFLASYLVYHYALGEYTGSHGRQFAGSSTAAFVYKSILIPHVILAVFVPVLALRVFQHAFREHWDAHRRLARITFPVWLFVSVTGVIIYWMLYQWPWSQADVTVS